MVLQGSPAIFLMCAHSFPLFQKGDRGGFPPHSTSPSAKKQTSPLPSPKRRGNRLLINPNRVPLHLDLVHPL